ncbi:MAG: hypothetical protein IPF41_16145 [Flavobacteriales bacterium]|nr:hypothetical protein [Flavobacteriales bacterium]
MDHLQLVGHALHGAEVALQSFALVRETLGQLRGQSADASGHIHAVLTDPTMLIGRRVHAEED